MTVTYHREIVQNSYEWYQIKTGILSASQMKSLVTPAKLQIADNDAVREHALDLAAQRVTGHVEETYQSWDMERGHIEEVYAADLYAENFHPVETCGFITNDRWGFTLGFSPDRLVGDDGFIEVKSRNQKIQLKTIIADRVPPIDMIQIQGGFLVSERKWCDYVTYSNGMEMFVKRVEPNKEIMEKLEAAAAKQEQRIEEYIQDFRKKSEGLIVAPRRDHETGEIIKPSVKTKEEDPVDPSVYLTA